MGQKLLRDYFSEQQSKIHDSHHEHHLIKQKYSLMSRKGLSFVPNQGLRYSNLSSLYFFWNNPSPGPELLSYYFLTQYNEFKDSEFRGKGTKMTGFNAPNPFTFSHRAAKERIHVLEDRQ